MKNNERLDNFPINIQEEVKETLKGWCGCYVERHEITKEYRISTGISLTKAHNPWQLIEAFNNTDVYTREEINKYSKEYWQGTEWY